MTSSKIISFCKAVGANVASASLELGILGKMIISGRLECWVLPAALVIMGAAGYQGTVSVALAECSPPSASTKIALAPIFVLVLMISVSLVVAVPCRFSIRS